MGRHCAIMHPAMPAIVPSLLWLLLQLTIGVAHGESDVNCGVVVVGATPSGVQAAVAAARYFRQQPSCAATDSCSVCLLEPSQYVGGMMSGGLGMTDVGVHPDVIGGQALEFFNRTAAHYNVALQPAPACPHSNPMPLGWIFEPHVAENVFLDMLADSGVHVYLGTRVLEVQKEHTGLQLLVTEAGRFAALQFVDSTYEGSLLKAAGASYTFGRESRQMYNESAAGVLPEPNTPGPPYGHTVQFKKPLDPFVVPGNRSSGLLPNVGRMDDVGVVGSRDYKIGAYDYRICLTTNVSNQLPLPPPINYDPTEYELLRRYIAQTNGTFYTAPSTNMPNLKSDWKIGGGPINGEYVGGNWDYPDANYTQQQAIVAAHKRYAVNLLYFLRTDPVVPQRVRDKLGTFGLPRDEFNRSGHWSPALYIRSALRLVGEYVMTQPDVQTLVTKDDVIGLGSYTVDIPGAVQRYYNSTSGFVLNEGSMQVPSLCVSDQAAFSIPYSSLTPKRTDASNLLVSAAISASHVAFNAVRMEPQFMIMGQSAGTAAAMVAHNQSASGSGAVQDLDIAKLQAVLRANGQVLVHSSQN